MRTFLLQAACLLLCLTVSGIDNASRNETAARIWFDKFDRELAAVWNANANAWWNYSIHMTAENEAATKRSAMRARQFFMRLNNETNSMFDWQNFSNADLRRRFSKACDLAVGTGDAQEVTRFGNLLKSMTFVFNSAVVKDPRGSNKKLKLGSDLLPLMADPNVSEPVKRLAWLRWRDATGRKMLANYTEFVQLINQSNRMSIVKSWQSAYEPEGDDFEASMEKMWNEVKPLYQQLHAFVRRKLRQKYGQEIFPPTGQIPAHLLGCMWALKWENVMKLTAPFPEHGSVDVTEKMRELNWDTMKMFRVSEDFFVSLGLNNMSSTFWEKSVLERIPNVTMDCSASAWDFFSNKQDFRILQCTQISTTYLATTHHEMGHLQYFHEYEKQPVVYREPANPGFHEAVGDTIDLSVMTPDHLKAIGLLDSTIESKEFYLNHLFRMALAKVAFFPFGLLVDRWRWRVFDGSIRSSSFNSEWWKLRCGLQGVASPVKRTNSDFDPGAKYHVAANIPYIRYFVAHVLQFQIYEALCKKANHTGPLYRCDFYGSLEAGKALRQMMRSGSSMHWKDVLEKLTGTRELSTAPLMTYFSDLKIFLEDFNRKSGERVGWDNSCPPDKWYDNLATSGTAAATGTTEAEEADDSKDTS